MNEYQVARILWLTVSTAMTSDRAALYSATLSAIVTAQNMQSDIDLEWSLVYFTEQVTVCFLRHRIATLATRPVCRLHDELTIKSIVDCINWRLDAVRCLCMSHASPRLLKSSLERRRLSDNIVRKRFERFLNNIARLYEKY